MATQALQTTQPEMVTAYKMREEEMFAALADRVPKELFSSVVLTMFRKAPKLLECTRDTVLPALYEIASMGLVPGLGQAYLLPFRNNKRGKMEATLVVGYQGYVELAYNSQAKIAIRACVVRVGDYFEWEEGLNPILIHRVNSEFGDQLLAAYAVATAPDGQKWHQVMLASEVLAIKARSKAFGSGPWVTDEEEMWKKTPVRRLFKMLPKSPAMAKAQEVDDVEAMDADFDVLPDDTPKPLSEGESDLAEELKQDQEENTGEPIVNDGPPDQKATAKSKKASNKKTNVKPKLTPQPSPAEGSAPSETSSPSEDDDGGAGPPLSDESVKMLCATADDFGMEYIMLDDIARDHFDVEDVEHVLASDLESFKTKLMEVGQS
jgi:recombination protein RecT